MHQPETLVPLSVIAAVILFFVKEILEFVRRRGADKRKHLSYRKLIARECELNAWVHRRLVSIARRVGHNFIENLEEIYSIDRSLSGEWAFRHQSDLTGCGSEQIPDVKMNIIERLFPEIAANDAKLFPLLETAYDALIDMRHVRNSLIRHVEDDDENYAVFFSGFPQWALGELDTTEKALIALYKECTGIDTLPHRVR